MFRLKFTGSHSLQDALDACMAMQKSVTTIGGSRLLWPQLRCCIQTMCIMHPSVAQYHWLSGPLGSFPEEMALPKTLLVPMPYFFTLDDVGGLAGIRQWLETANRYAPKIESLTSHWYMPEIYVENRFLNLVMAAGPLVRIKKQRQRINFANGLKELADLAGEPFRVLAGSLEAWVVKVR